MQAAKAKCEKREKREKRRKEKRREEKRDKDSIRLKGRVWACSPKGVYSQAV